MAQTQNKIFNIIQENLEQEIGTLLDEDFVLKRKSTARTSKAELIDFIQSKPKKSVLTSMQVTGDNSFQAYILMSLQDAVRFGGILIMLPEDEIDSRIKAKTLEGEDADAFDEIVNIFSGVLSNSLQKTSAKNIHFKKNAVEIVSAQGDDPLSQKIVDQSYVQGSYSIGLGEKELDFLELFMPEALFKTPEEIQEQKQDQENPPDSEKPSKEQERNVHLEADEKRLLTSEFSESEKQEPKAQDLNETELDTREYIEERDVQKTFNKALPEIQEALTDLLGQSLTFADITYQFISKEDYCAERRSNWIITRFAISGEFKGQGNFLCTLKDALYLGGTLLMVPEEEIKQQSKKGLFEGELADSFGEIANIVVGTCSNIFYEHYPQKLHFKREDIESFNPSKEDNYDKIPEEINYLISGKMYLEETVLGSAEFLFSPKSLGLKEPEKDTRPEERDQQRVLKKDDHGKSVVEEPVEFKEELEEETEQDQPLVYVILNDDQQKEIFNNSLKDFDKVRFQNVNLDTFFKEKKDKNNICGAFLVLDKVDDYGLAYVIQVKATMKSKSPLILGGPQWTRSDVIKAVRYGARDILVTPPRNKDIRQKFEKHIYQNINGSQS